MGSGRPDPERMRTEQVETVYRQAHYSLVHHVISSELFGEYENYTFLKSL